VVVNVAPVVRFVMVRVKFEPDAETSADMLSPGWMVMDRFTGGLGYISYHA
jgi:hypothetical protein